MNKKCRNVCLTLMAAFCALLIADCFYYRQRTYPGVYSHNISLGRKNLSEMKNALRQAQVILVGPDGATAVLTFQELGIRPKGDAMFTAVYQYGRNKPWPLNFYDRILIMRKKAYVPLQYEVEKSGSSHSADFLEKTFNKNPTNAYYRISKDGRQVCVVPEVTGYRLNREKYPERLQDVFTQPEATLTVMVPFDELPAKLSAVSLHNNKVEKLVSSFSTTFDAAITDRVHNMSLASSQINGTLLAPGEVFSINKILGDSTPEKGYRKAPIISGGELVPGYGGGLCQVSTTLYNAALLANLEILERHNHQLAVPYVPPGRDATIFYGSKDLQFRNNKDHHVLIHSSVDGHEIVFSIFGAAMKETVKIESEILDVYMPPVRNIYTPELPAGKEVLTEGEPGFLVEVWKSVFHGDTLIRKNKVSTDFYQPYPIVIKRGVAAPNSAGG